MTEPSLTSLSHGGGCGCKADPAALRELLKLAEQTAGTDDERLLVGNATADDCAAWLLDDGAVLVATTDFFMPVVDDPRDFGRIAASNAISDIYAMGATPIFALALAGMPLDKLSAATVGAVLAGGKEACAAAGIPVAGGHTITSSEPLYGLAVTGLCARDELARNDTAQPGDHLVLGKPLGIGILSAAFRSGKLDADGYRELLATTTQLNLAGPRLAQQGLIHAMTDVTGFGLLGHTLEMCQGASLGATLSFGDVPLLAAARKLAQAGVATGASKRNLHAYGTAADCTQLSDWQRTLLSDPQTSGGLLVACAPGDTAAVLGILHELGFAAAGQVGCMDATDGVRVTA